MTVFKAYDIRGTVPEQLDADLAYAIGRAAAHHLRQSASAQSPADTALGPVAVGRDARAHSPELTEALVRGLNDEGLDVVDLGLVATPIVYFAVDRIGAAAGIMVTASHNPGQYNGFKMCRAHAVPIGEDTGLREIEALVEARRGQPPADERGRVEELDVVDLYVEHVLAVAPGRPELHVAIDCGNGMAAVALEPLLERLPLEVERLYFEPDGTFPNHEANPLAPENLEDVCRAVKRTGADLGVAFDGDADRAVFVDERGDPITSDLVTALFARRVLRQKPGAKVLYDLRSSRAVAEEIAAAGGVPEMCRVGHSFIKAQMRESGASFAGELSGHFYFRFNEHLVADDGIAAFVAMLDVLAERAVPVSELVDPLRRYAASGEINRRVADTAAVITAIERDHAAAPERSKLDGLLVRYPDWWFNLRPSNTEPVIRLNLEAESEAQMANERDRLLARIEELADA